VVPELTFAELAAVFGEQGVWRADPATLPDGLRHDGTRGFLTGVGLPRTLRDGFIDLDESVLDGRFPTLPEVYRELGPVREWSWQQPDGADHWYVIAHFVGGDVAVDGDSGRVWFLPEWDAPPEPLNSGVDAFAYFMYAFERDRELYSAERADRIEDDPDDPRDGIAVFEEAARALARELHAADPTPFTTDDFQGEPFPDGFAGPWTQAFEDIAGGMWG